MTIRYRQNVPYPLGFSRNCGSKTLAIAVAMCCVLATGTALAGGGDEDDDQARFCSATTSAQFTACASEVKDDFFVAKAKCINVSAEKKRKECFVEAKVAREEGKQRCGAQRHGAVGDLRRARALLLLKGLSSKEIAAVRAVSERTVREQARSIYSKAGLTGRAALSAFFLEDLLAPIEGVE